jgi:hypothetical protein
VDIEKLISECGHDPTDIGIRILEEAGYVVRRFLSGAISVMNNAGDCLYYFEGCVSDD